MDQRDETIFQPSKILEHLRYRAAFHQSYRQSYFELGKFLVLFILYCVVLDLHFDSYTSYPIHDAVLEALFTEKSDTIEEFGDNLHEFSVSIT